jgi:hypothetical protein
MNKKIAFGLCTLLVGLLGVVASQRTAQAGANTNATVSLTINSNGTGTASGAMGVARSTSDTSQFVTCSIHTNGPAGSFWGCSAQTTTSSVTCAVDTTDSQWVSSFLFLTEMMNPDSYVMFQWKTVNGSRVCTIIRVENDSRYAPKVLP